MNRTSAIGPAAVVCGVAMLLTGCTPSNSAASAAMPAATQAPVTSSVDADACAQLTAPISLVLNAQQAPDGAMDKVTARGLYFTAAWEFDRIGKGIQDSDLSAPLTALEQASNAMNVDMNATDDPTKWADNLDKINAAVPEVRAVCMNIDENWGTLGWYGG